MLIASLNTRDIDLLPLDGHIIGLKNHLDGLRHLSANAVTCRYSIASSLLFPADDRTWDQGDSVLAAKFGGLEDVLAESCHCYRAIRPLIFVGFDSRLHRAAMEGPARQREGLTPRST